jgi:hypothetical protein
MDRSFRTSGSPYIFFACWQLSHGRRTSHISKSSLPRLAAMILKDNAGPIKRFDPELSKENYMVKNQPYNFLNEN